MELPDWLRGLVLLGRDGAEYRVVALDADGNMGVILQAAAEVTIPGDVSVDQNDSIREMQGVEGVTLRTVAVDANGQIIMVPRGATGNYMAVDASGYLGAILMADAAVTIAASVDVAQDDSVREMQGVEGVTLRTVAVDANGQIIMVPRGSGGNYLAVDGDGYLTTVMKGVEGATLRTIATDANGVLRAQIKGLDGATTRTIAVDGSGQMIMVPRGQSGNYLGVDADGYMTTVMKGTYGAVLKTLAADDEGYLVAILKDNSDQWGKKISVGLAELAARLGSPISWDRRGQVAKIQTFAQGLGDGVIIASGTGASATLSPSYFQTGGYGYKLTTGTTVNKSAGVTIYGDFPPSGRMGFEFVFSMQTQPDDIYLLGRVWDGTYEHRAYARIHDATDKFQIQNDTPAYEDVCDFALPPVGSLFSSVKVVVDIDEQEWVRLLLRGTEYDLSAVPIYSPAVVVTPYFSFQILAVESAAASHTMYLDRMIVTTNEP